MHSAILTGQRTSVCSRYLHILKTENAEIFQIKIHHMHFSHSFTVFPLVNLTFLIAHQLIFYFPLSQNVEYQTAMDCLQKADRQSLLSEIQALRAQVNGRKMILKREHGSSKPGQGVLCDQLLCLCK